MGLIEDVLTKVNETSVPPQVVVLRASYKQATFLCITEMLSDRRDILKLSLSFSLLSFSNIFRGALPSNKLGCCNKLWSIIYCLKCTAEGPCLQYLFKAMQSHAQKATSTDVKL